MITDYSSLIGTAEEVVLSAEGQGTDLVLDEVVVDFYLSGGQTGSSIPQVVLQAG